MAADQASASPGLSTRCVAVTDPDPNVSHARARMAEARKHAEAGDRELALQTYDSLLAEAGSSQSGFEPPLRRWVAAAFRNRLLLLQKAERYEQGLSAAREIVARYGDEAPPEYPFLVGDALLREAFFLRKLNRRSETLQTYATFVARFGDSAEPAVREMVAATLGARIEQLALDGLYAEAVETAGNLNARFVNEATPVIQQHVTDAMCKSAEALGKLGRWQDALATDELVIHRGDDATGGAWPQAHKAVALLHPGRSDEARDVWAEIVDRFEHDDSPLVQALAREAEERLSS
jgi:tetratricopeptide (TPR) repeat protein